MTVANYLFVFRSFRLLLKHRPGRLALVFLFNLFMGFFQGFSIVLLIPLLQLLNVDATPPDNQLVQFFRKLAELSGISWSIESVLLVYILFLSIIALLHYAESLVSAGYQKSFIYQLRIRLFRKIILADWSFLNSKSRHNHLQVLTREVPNMAEYYQYFIRLIAQGLVILAHLLYAMLVSVPFTAMVLTAGVLLFIFLRKYLFRSFKLGSDYVDSYYHLLKTIDDFWQTVKIAKVHSSETFYYNKYDAASHTLLDLEYGMAKNYALSRFFYTTAGIIILVVVVYLGYRLGNIPVSSFFILILLFARIFPLFTAINTDVNMIYSTMSSVKLVKDLDEQFAEHEFNQSEDGLHIPVQREIRISNLCFSYPDSEPLFSDFNETIPAGAITGILGESGLGKTTLIDLIAGLQKPLSGEITIDGVPLSDPQLSVWKSSIGYLPQDSFFIDGSLRENLVWDSREDVSNDDILEVLRQVNASHLVNRFPGGLEQEVVNYPLNFSGGERQRLALARVLLRKPRLLLLDEATSSLDTENEQNIMEVLANLKKKVTIVFVTHRSSLCPWFDKVIRL